MSMSPCRFCKWFACLLAGFAVFMGFLLTLQAGFGLERFGGHEHLPRITALQLLRSIGPATAGSAVLFALLIWAHPLPPPELAKQLTSGLKRALIAGVLGYPVAVLLGSISSLLAGWALFGVGPRSFAAAAWQIVAARDVADGLLTTSLDVGLIVFLAWRALPWLQRSGWSLPGKLVLAWTVSVIVRTMLGLAASLSSLSG
jgi:hypothetical protein